MFWQMSLTSLKSLVETEHAKEDFWLPAKKKK